MANDDLRLMTDRFSGKIAFVQLGGWSWHRIFIYAPQPYLRLRWLRVQACP